MDRVSQPPQSILLWNKEFVLGVGMQTVASPSPTAYGWADHQSKLPRLPLPELRLTLERYLLSVEHLMSPSEYRVAKEDALHFLHHEGKSLHAELKERNRLSTAQQLNTSYNKDFWNNMYLSGRYPLPINSNPFFRLKSDPTSVGKSQAQRAAKLVCAYTQFYFAMLEKRLLPDMLGPGTPGCMDEYGRLFACSRIPLSGEDVWRCSPGSKHIAILRGNDIYTITILHPCDGVIEEELLASKLQTFLDETRTNVNDGDFLGHLCSTERNSWAQVRSELVDEDVYGTTNQTSLDKIDSALFVLALDYDSAKGLDEEMECGLHGGVTRHRWFDKTFNLSVCPKGEAVVNFEHSMYDGAAILRLLDDSYYMMLGDAPKIGKPFQYKWWSPPTGAEAPEKLNWTFSSNVRKAIQAARKFHAEQCENVKLACIDFSQYGSRQLKQWGLSPDATAQICFQWAYAKLHGGKPVYCYESASTKRFLCGRTEVIRSSTAASKQFVDGMVHRKIAKTEARRLFKAACAVHRSLARDAVNGHGVDRHLFAMFNIARKRSQPLPAIFQNKAWEVSNASILSTSHVPSNGIHGLGFGPVVPMGYGIAYEVLDDRIIVTFSNFKRLVGDGSGGFGGVARKAEDPPGGSLGTDCVLLRATFQQCLEDLRSIFDDDVGESRSKL